MGFDAAGTAPGPATVATTSPAGPTAGPTLETVAMATQLAKAREPRFVTSFGKPGVADGELTLPFDVALAPDGTLYVSDSTGVQRFRADGSFVARVGGRDLPQARGVAVGPDGRLYVTGFGAEVRVYDNAGAQLPNLGATGSGAGQFDQPVDATVDTDGNVYVVDKGNRTVQKFGPDGRFLEAIGAAGGGRGQFSIPWSVGIGPTGDIFISSADDYLIQHYTADGTFVNAVGTSHQSDTIWQTAGVSFDDQGYLYALQVPTNMIQSYDVQRDPPSLRWEFGGLGSDPGQFTSASSLTVVGRRLFVADTSNHRIQEFLLAEEE